MRRSYLTTLAATLICGLGAVQSAGAQAQAGNVRSSASDVIAAERALWEQIKANQWAAFDKAVNGMTYVDTTGMMIYKSGNLKQFEGLVTRSYSLDSIRTITVTPDVIVLTYKASFDQTDAKGMKSRSPIYMMSVWQRKNGRWAPVAHSETPVGGAPSSSTS